MRAMKRATEKPSPKNTRWGKPPKPYGVNDLMAARAVLLEYAGQIRGICVRMRENNLDSITIPAGSGGEAQDRAEESLASLLRGLTTAIVEGVKRQEHPLGDTPQEPDIV